MSLKRLLSQRLAEAGIRHRYEVFDDDHSDIDYRMDVSLPVCLQGADVLTGPMIECDRRTNSCLLPTWNSGSEPV